jgi:Tfp pilus assembly protein FimV
MASGSGRRLLIRFGAPAAFLAAVTAAVLLVRAGLDREASAPVATTGNVVAAVVSRASPRPAPAARKRFYVIRAGDTLDAVAGRLGTTVERLLRLNPDVRPTSLRIGQKIRTA